MAPGAVDGVLLPMEGSGFVAPSPVTVPTQNAYSLRLVVSRTLYDHGTLLAHSPSSAGLARSQSVRINPADALPLGVTDGQDGAPDLTERFAGPPRARRRRRAPRRRRVGPPYERR